jgi:hypothetical protein
MSADLISPGIAFFFVARIGNTRYCPGNSQSVDGSDPHIIHKFPRHIKLFLGWLGYMGANKNAKNGRVRNHFSPFFFRD